MSIKSKVLAAAATLTLVGGAAGALAAGPANAATPSCGHRCVNLFSKKFSDVLTTKPGFVLDVFRQAARVGQPVIMFQASNADPAQDFTVSLEGGSATSSPPTDVPPRWPCTTATTSRGKSSTRQNGVNTGLCVGTPVLGGAPGNNTPVSLQACGVKANTVWVTSRSEPSAWRRCSLRRSSR